MPVLSYTAMQDGDEANNQLFNTRFLALTNAVNALDSANLVDNSITTPKIASLAVTAGKLSGVDKSLLTTDSNPYKFSAYLNSAQNTGTSGFFLVNIDAEEYDTNSNFNTTTHLYTAPVNGHYLITGCVLFIGQNGSPKLVSLAKNSTTLEFKRLGEIPNTTGNVTISGTVILQLVAGDTIGLLGYSIENKALNVDKLTTYFQICLMWRT